MAKIKIIKAREILDSKGNPTVEVDLVTNDGLFQASVPSGVSKGKYEALELRDACLPAGREEKRYGGRGVLKAVKNVNEIIGPQLKGKDPTGQKEIDGLMIELDGTENKSKLGANAILAVSIAVCRAGAKTKNLPLHQYLAEIYRGLTPVNQLPTPCLLMIEGGLHSGSWLNFQEFMIVPGAESFNEKLRIGVEIYYSLGSILEKKFGKFATNVGFEGGFAPPLRKTEEALNLIVEAIAEAGYRNKTKIVIDIAASTFYKNKVYHFEGGAFTRKGLTNFYSDLLEKYPIFGLEDLFDQEDWKGFEALTKKLGKKILIIGDDFLVTNPQRIKKAIEENCANAVVIKPNQIGSVTETIEAARLAQEAGWEVFVKHRSGDTTDDFIADLAVGLGAKYIMAGAPTRGERVAKYNRLLRIEEEMKELK